MRYEVCLINDNVGLSLIDDIFCPYECVWCKCNVTNDQWCTLCL